MRYDPGALSCTVHSTVETVKSTAPGETFGSAVSLHICFSANASIDLINAYKTVGYGHCPNSSAEHQFTKKFATLRAMALETRNSNSQHETRRVVLMKQFMGLVLVLSLVGCAVCKSSDTPEQCRTKQRDHSQPRIDFAGTTGAAPRLVALLMRTLQLNNPLRY